MDRPGIRGILIQYSHMKNSQPALIETEHTMQQAMIEKAVAQGKFEIASDILHDIGNALVGFGSYLNRIKHSVELDDPKNLISLSAFLTAQQAGLSTVIGEAKAGAVIGMLGSIVESQQSRREEIQKSIVEQLNIITHIQEILNIQRQYNSGLEAKEIKPVNLRSIINDCLSMLFASIEKRGIVVTIANMSESPIVYGDRTRLMQVVMNIIKNSVEAIDTNAMAKTISISLHSGDGLIILEVKDSGNGFDEATAVQLFERGFTTKSSGTGLGLHSSMAIVESHAGNMSIASEGPGKGALTTIKFKI
jgi:signal transduction histidine kinase